MSKIRLPHFSFQKSYAILKSGRSLCISTTIRKEAIPMKKILALILALSLLVLCGCGSAPVETEPSTEPSAATTEPTTEATTEPTTDPTTEATEPSPQYRHPLTGRLMEEPLKTRLLTAAIGNTKDAMPTRGLSQADIVFEMYVNGLTTRLLGMFSNPTDVYAIGSIRSQRLHFTDISHSYDTIAISAGGSGYVMGDVKRSGIDYMNVDTSGSTSYAFRDQDRRSQGYSREHTLFALGGGLYDYAVDNGFRTEFNQEKDYGMRWAEDKALTEGQSASTVTLTFRLSSSRKDSVFTFNPDTGLYGFTQYGMEMVDGSGGTPLSFRNIFIIMAKTWTETASGNHYHVSELVGSGEGYFACDGYMIPVQWHRATEDDVFTFTLTDGTPLEQGVGTSYIAIAPLKSEVTAE